DQADLLGLLGTKDPSRVRNLLHPAQIADNLWQPGQSANVRSNTNVDLLDGELCVRRGNTNVAGGGDVESETVGNAVDHCNDRLLAHVDGANGGLEGVHHALQSPRSAGGILLGALGQSFGSTLDVE